jgi:hypothetical protein
LALLAIVLNKSKDGKLQYMYPMTVRNSNTGTHSMQIYTPSSREGIVIYVNKVHVVNDTIASDTNSITQSKEGFTTVFLHDDSLVKDAHVNVDEYEDYDGSNFSDRGFTVVMVLSSLRD